jgi:Phosphotransferase enzyme family
MPNYIVIDAPSNLGLRPTGIETLPIALKSAGLLTKLSATYAGRVSPLPYHLDRDPLTHMRNADAIRIYAQHLADAVSPQMQAGHLMLLAAVPSSTLDITADTAAWVTFLEQSLHHDLPLSPCRPAALERTALGKRFVAHARQAFVAARPTLVAAHDTIHGDFSVGNILCDDDGTLTAVLDWQHGSVGHRGFDLIGLEWDLALRLDVGSAPALALVTARVNEQVAEPVRSFCRAYYGVWNLSWALDTPDEAAILRAATTVGVV